MKGEVILRSLFTKAGGLGRVGSSTVPFAARDSCEMTHEEEKKNVLNQVKSHVACITSD